MGGKKYYSDMDMGQWLNHEDGTNLSTVLNTELGLEMETHFG